MSEFDYLPSVREAREAFRNAVSSEQFAEAFGEICAKATEFQYIVRNEPEPELRVLPSRQAAELLNPGGYRNKFFEQYNKAESDRTPKTMQHKHPHLDRMTGTEYLNALRNGEI